MKKKKLIALIGVSMLTICMAVGCGKTPGAEEIADTETTDDDVEWEMLEEGDIDLSEGEKIAGVSKDGEDADEDGSSADGAETSDEEAEEEEEEDVPDENLFTESTMLDEGSNLSFNFEAQKEHIGSVPENATMEDKAGDLNKARWESLLLYYEGVQEDAQEEMDDLKASPAITDACLAKIKPYYSTIARYIQAAGIKHYDITLPYYEDSEEVDFDMYTENYTTFYLSIYFKEDGSIDSFDMFEENSDDELDESDIEFEEGDDEDDEDGSILLDVDDEDAEEEEEEEDSEE
ncbi:MAG: hypothetical protein K6E75_05180 [Lachnospiraceae bacterium]|nr:hypothetical protein [Lachnospiraceae bacterium]